MPKRKNYQVDIAWNNFTGKKAILPICVRSPAIQGRKFEATLAAMQTQLDHVHVVICDLLDRHNLARGSDDPAADSLRRANNWLKQYYPKILEYFPDHTMVRWNEIQAHKEFDERLSIVNTMYKAGTDMTGMIDYMSYYYLNQKIDRLYSQGYEVDHALEIERSTNYLLEEMAGDMIYYQLYNAPRVYWGLYVSDTNIFRRSAVQANIKTDLQLDFPQTCAVDINFLPASVSTCELISYDFEDLKVA